ncbi:hypothetical protein AGMMS49545_07680 [Betaproteobacteria bacterium]|nr:hypothetical protein AGMMS49545_07680 [Betaproteobacteria bacterium]GHU42707.1 hypothetical protein AGMMS50289_07860 [Betaproteobacteria bacterium]
MSKQNLSLSPAAAPQSGEDSFSLEDVGDLEAAARVAFADEARIGAGGSILPNDPGLQFPDLLAEGEAPRQRVKSNAGTQQTRAGAAGALLGGLREQAHGLLEQQAARERQHYQHAAQLDRSLRQVFAYLHDMVQQLNVVRPSIPRDYPLADQQSLHGLVWQQGYADYRTSSLSEQAFMEIVTLTYRLVGQDKPVVLDRDGNLGEIFRQRLFDFNLNMKVKESRNKHELLESVRITIAQEVNVNVRWEPDYDDGVLLVHVRNLERLGYATYRLPADAPMNPTLMEEFGRMVLGHPHRFPHVARHPS